MRLAVQRWRAQWVGWSSLRVDAARVVRERPGLGGWLCVLGDWLGNVSCLALALSAFGGWLAPRTRGTPLAADQGSVDARM